MAITFYKHHYYYSAELKPTMLSKRWSLYIEQHLMITCTRINNLNVLQRSHHTLQGSWNIVKNEASMMTHDKLGYFFSKALRHEKRHTHTITCIISDYFHLCLYMVVLTHATWFICWEAEICKLPFANLITREKKDCENEKSNKGTTYPKLLNFSLVL